MFVNTYDFTLQNADNEEINVSLRLGTGAQIQLKKQFNESTTRTLFEAADDIERFNAIMDKSLKWKGNKNTIQSGEELIDLMAANGMLGMIPKQKIITALGVTSGVFSEKEKKMIDNRADHMYDEVLADEEEADGAAKN